MVSNESRKNALISNAVKLAKTNRVNRVYYTKASEAKDFFQSGAIQSSEKNKYDSFCLEESQNDAIFMYGIEPDGSHFELELSVVSLYDNILKPDKEHPWRLGRVSFIYNDTKTKSKYSYKHEELIDFGTRRVNAENDKHSNENVIKIGCLTLEVVIAFGINRILFQGLFVKEYENGLHQLIPGRLAISTHPTSDKFDYTYRFNSVYSVNAIKGSLDNDNINKPCDRDEDPADLIRLMLENRIDQPLMYHAHFDITGLDSVKSLMWGSKTRHMINSSDEDNHEIRESLMVWAECGHLINLSRPISHPNLLNGMIHNTFDYPSHIYSASWGQDGGEECSFERDIGRLPSFNTLKSGTKIKLVAFKTKVNVIEILEDVAVENCTLSKDTRGPFRIRVNGFDGWAMHRRYDIGSLYMHAQSKLMMLNLSDNKWCLKLASDHLLGGKGNSLVELNRLVQIVDKRVPNVVETSPNKDNCCSEVNVPNGLIVTSLAYKVWLDSDPRISFELMRLDATRRILSARSYFVNPFCDSHLTMTEQHKQLTEECNRCVSLLESCPLPETIRCQLKSQLESVFGETDSWASDKVFAIRSSALGEDSLETSAAGQMKTFLDAKGFEMICKSVVSCWASQFELPAITYKTQNGLSFNWPMAVVIQELIECHSAGVGATCDPLMGNPRQLEITACLGMGEGVVAGRATDTIRLDLTELAWDFERETVGTSLNSTNIEKCIDVEQADYQQAKRYLSNQLLASLGNLLLWIRNNRNDNLKDREVEWGMTLNGDNKSNSSFTIHLFQSRPLTNLQRLSTREVDFELDTGLSGPAELISRANIGEVMPGTFSPLSSSTFTQQSVTVFNNDYNDKNYSMKFNANPAFAYSARIPCLNVTDPGLVHQLGGGVEKADRKAFAMMAGIEPEIAESLMRLVKEKINPLHKYSGTFSNMHYYMNDIAMLDVKMAKLKRHIAVVESNLKLAVPTTIEQWVRQIDDAIRDGSQAGQDSSTTASDAINKLAEIQQLIAKDVEKMFKFVTQYDNPLYPVWYTFHEASQSSIYFNRSCIEHMSRQPYYMKPENTDKVLTDFSYLIKGTTKTESGDISHILENMVESLCETYTLEEVDKMSATDLYKLLTNDNHADDKTSPNDQSSKSIGLLYKKFMLDNGHRGYKEYDIACKTWIDDPSQIIKSLQGRVKQRLSRSNLSSSSGTREQENDEGKNEKRIEEILSHIEHNKIWFKSYLITGAKRGIVRREAGKSLFVYTVHQIRLAYRHLAGLLCLLGLIPSVEFIPYLNIEELASIIGGPWLKVKDNAFVEASRADISRLLFKARRRQQRTRVLDRVSPPKPTVRFTEFYDLIYEMTEDRSIRSGSITTKNDNSNPSSLENGNSDKTIQVRGLTSCGGLVTGRACVISSLDQVDEIQEGDILITYSIDVSWTVYFYALSGIVTELGGLVSHGAVVAREYAIPTLCTALGACSKFKTGQIVTLDANNSCCYLAEE